VVGGGINPNHKNDELVQKYVAEVKKVAKERGVEVTGFVPDKKMAIYLSACDMMIFPYRTFLSSSGPLALAWSYGKPAILSEALRAYGESKDVGENLKTNNLKIEDLTFTWKAKEVEQTVTRVWEKRKQIENFDRAMLESRSLTTVAQKTWRVVE
jgi:glycosyltransferase involved in cell wall biosynthesis